VSSEARAHLDVGNYASGARTNVAASMFSLAPTFQDRDLRFLRSAWL